MNKSDFSQQALDLAAWDKAHLWHPFTPMKHWLDEEVPIITASEGDYLIDDQGRRLIDGVSSLWTNLHGHNHPRLNKAMKEQIDRVSHSTFLGLSHPPGILLAREIVKIAPPGLTRVFYSEAGATAVEIALKMAFQYHCQKKNPEPERTLFLALDGAYHGDTLGAVSVGGMDLFHKIFGPLLFETVHAPQSYCYRCPLDQTHPDCGLACAEAFEELIEQEADRLAAVIVEPLVQGAAGIITQPPGYLKRIFEAAKRAGVLFIADEVATGFGRTGTMFACQQEGVAPDLMSLGKGLSGGYLPLAATLASEEIFEAFLHPQWEGKTFFHGHTFTGNPIACAAGLANLAIFENEETLKKLQPKIELLASLLAPLAERPYIGQVRQQGFMAGLEMVSDKATRAALDPTRRLPQKITALAREKGVVIRPLDNVMVLMPPLSLAPQNLEKLVEATGQAMEETLGD